MTVFELRECEKRIDQITETLDLCDPKFDCDVIDNLEVELQSIMERLESVS